MTGISGNRLGYQHEAILCSQLTTGASETHIYSVCGKLATRKTQTTEKERRDGATCAYRRREKPKKDAESKKFSAAC